MPEGDSIYRAARTLHRALAGRTITRFESVFPQLTRVDVDAPLRGRIVERVEARGKHLLIWFTGDLVLRTHMRMRGSWHIYRPGERWQRAHHDMRIVIETTDMHAIAFTVPIAEFVAASDLERSAAISELGPDLLAPDFDAAEAVRRIHAQQDVEIADALLDQRALAGIGNIFKSETLFVARINPFILVRDLPSDILDRIVSVAGTLMRANVGATASGGIVTYSGLRRTATRDDPSPRLWVYGRAGKPCRRCGTLIQHRKQGVHARGTYWCERCQNQNPKAQIPSPKSQR